MSAELRIEKEVHNLNSGEYTPWIRLRFRTAMRTTVSGIVRFLLTSTEPDVSLYMSPINIDPDDPACPSASHPSTQPTSRTSSAPFATTGMAEDTWALNEGVIDGDAFLKQAWGIFEERESMFLSALENTRRGVVACVFRYERPHPAYVSTGNSKPATGRMPVWLRLCTGGWTYWSGKL